MSRSSRWVTLSSFLRRSVICCLVGGSPGVSWAQGSVAVGLPLLFGLSWVAGLLESLWGFVDSWTRRRRCRILRYPADSSVLSCCRDSATVVLSGLVVMVLRRPTIAQGVRLLTRSACGWLDLALRWPCVSRRVVSRSAGLLAVLVLGFIPRERRMGARLLGLARCLGLPDGSGHV